MCRLDYRTCRDQSYSSETCDLSIVVYLLKVTYFICHLEITKEILIKQHTYKNRAIQAVAIIGYNTGINIISLIWFLGDANTKHCVFTYVFTYLITKW